MYLDTFVLTDLPTAFRASFRNILCPCAPRKRRSSNCGLYSKLLWEWM